MPNFHQFSLFLFIIQFSSTILLIHCSPILESKSEHLNAIKNDLIQTMYGGKNPFRGHLNQPCKTNTNCGLLEYCSSGRCACAFSFKEITVSSIQRCTRFECTENGECLQEFGENTECGQEKFCTCIQPYRINLFTQNCSVKIDTDSPEVAKIRAYGTIFVKPECSEDSDCFVKYGDKQLTCEHYSRQCIKYASLSPEFKEMFNLYTNLTLDNHDPQNATESSPIDPKDSSNSKTRKRSYLFSYLTFIPILIIGMICYYFFLEESTHRVRIVRNLRREAVANGEGFIPTSEELRSINLRSALLNSLMSRHMAAQGIGSSSSSSHHFRDDPISVIIFNAHDSSLNAVFDREFNNWSSNSSTNRQEEERSTLLGKDLPPSYDEVVHVVPLATPEDIHQDIHQETHHKETHQQETHQETHQGTNQETHQETHQENHQETHQGTHQGTHQETPSTSHEPYHDPVQPPPYDSLRHSSENLNDI